MNILYYDCFSGISGDMNLAAMIDLGVDPEVVKTELAKLGIEDEFSLKISRDSRKGIFGTRVDVELAHAHHHNHDGEHTQPHGHSHEEHTHCGHHHEHGHGHGHSHHDHNHSHHHEHRNLKDIEEMISSSSLSNKVKATSLAIFKRVAEAEAKIHGSTLYEVHFHEVGATDSIIDIVGAAVCFHELEIDAVWSSAIELGGGFVDCAHGKMPVPAPATSEILAGKPTTQGAVPKETTTPTGAAILAELVDNFSESPRMIVQKTAYGIGHRDNEIPNVLRVQLAKVEEQASSLPMVPSRMLQCNIDDMTGEMLGAALEQLMEDGAMDVHFTPIVMKKNRPATTLSLLCSAEDEEKFKRLIFKHTTTLGIKSIDIEKTVLGISFDKLETPLGTVTMKNAILDGKIVRSKPELEDCRALAKQHGIPLSEVYLQIGKVRKI
ncbi:nickel pincer cofactor biosynthesis protein LarC [Maridesulfovibrio sp.]|uniref:nickel pincer cofactor biosynthesis protein LarC n=1 Tax=Maridesulfovibrio sp. TaxID=2795000 RepID=UPI0029F4A458|nr:nickel pincer cofactor biosynthesis protein LarC [Maridesulfovibrio sp.]